MATKTDIILKGPENWNRWDREFKTRAVAMDLWDYIKEDPKELLNEPAMPNPDDYKTSGVATRSQSTTASDRSTIDLNPEETRNFQIA